MTLNIPLQIRQGDSASWTDGAVSGPDGTQYDSSLYTLKYQITGEKNVLLTAAVAPGSAWKTTMTTVQSAGLNPGPYAWVAQVFASGVRVTVGNGQLIVDPDLSAINGIYDSRTVAQKALADAEAALASFSASKGRIKAYTIGGRQMQFQDDASLLEIVNYWRARVVSEQFQANGGKNRNIRIRFQSAR